MKYDLVTLVVIMILKDTATFKVLFIVSLFCIWNITTVEINSGVHTYLKVISAKCLCKAPLFRIVSGDISSELALPLQNEQLLVVFWS